MASENPVSSNNEMWDFSIWVQKERLKREVEFNIYKEFIVRKGFLIKKEVIVFLKERLKYQKDPEKQNLLRKGIERVRDMNKILILDSNEYLHFKPNISTNSVRYWIFDRKKNTLYINSDMLIKFFNVEKKEISLETNHIIIHELFHASDLDMQRIIFWDNVKAYFFSSDSFKDGRIYLSKVEIDTRAYTLLFEIRKFSLNNSNIITEKDLFSGEFFWFWSQTLIKFFKQENKIPELLELLNDWLAKNDLDNRLESDLEQIA